MEVGANIEEPKQIDEYQWRSVRTSKRIDHYGGRREYLHIHPTNVDKSDGVGGKVPPWCLLSASLIASKAYLFQVGAASLAQATPTQGGGVARDRAAAACAK